MNVFEVLDRFGKTPFVNVSLLYYKMTKTGDTFWSKEINVFKSQLDVQALFANFNSSNYVFLVSPIVLRPRPQ